MDKNERDKDRKRKLKDLGKNRGKESKKAKIRESGGALLHFN